MKQFEHYRNSIFGRNEEEILWEIRSLREIATKIYSGFEVTVEQLGTGNYPAVKCGDVSNSLFLQFHDCINFVNPNLIEKKSYCEHGDILISKLSKKMENVGKASAYLGNEKCLAGGGVTIVKHNQNPRYLSYALSTNFCRQQVKSLLISSMTLQLLTNACKKIKIPLPDLETQNQIANSLSRFIELSSEIDCELRLTNKQYEYYKELILN